MNDDSVRLYVNGKYWGTMSREAYELAVRDAGPVQRMLAEEMEAMKRRGELGL